MDGYRRVVAGIVEKDGLVLIGRKKHDPGHFLSNEWHIPGGKALPEETDEQALIREMREETGLEVKVERLVDESIHEPSKRLVKWYFCRPLAGTLNPKDDLVDARFVSKSQALSMYSKIGISLMPEKVLEYLRN